MAEVIDTQSLSYEAIREDLIDYINGKPDAQKWKDFFESGAGITITDLIAGLGSYHAFKQLMRRRESYLDTAQLETSIYELAFNRGFMVPPTNTYELTLRLKANSALEINPGDNIGFGDLFDVYSQQFVAIPADTEAEVECVCGNLQTFNLDVTGLDPFTTLIFVSKVKCS